MYPALNYGGVWKREREKANLPTNREKAKKQGYDFSLISCPSKLVPCQLCCAEKQQSVIVPSLAPFPNVRWRETGQLFHPSRRRRVVAVSPLSAERGKKKKGESWIEGKSAARPPYIKRIFDWRPEPGGVGGGGASEPCKEEGQRTVARGSKPSKRGSKRLRGQRRCYSGAGQRAALAAARVLSGGAADSPARHFGVAASGGERRRWRAGG